MDEPTLRQLIDDVRSGTLDPDTAMERLRRLPFAEVGDALVDHHRALRQRLLAVEKRGQIGQSQHLVVVARQPVELGFELRPRHHHLGLPWPEPVIAQDSDRLRTIGRHAQCRAARQRHHQRLIGHRTPALAVVFQRVR